MADSDGTQTIPVIGGRSDVVESRPTQLLITSHTVRMDIDIGQGRYSTQILPLKNLSIFGHGEIMDPNVTWRMVLLVGLAVLPTWAMLTALDFLPWTPWLVIAGLVIYRAVRQPATGLILMTNSGFTRLFTSKEYEPVQDVTEAVFAILEDPERYANSTFKVSICDGIINGSFIAGDVQGDSTSKVENVDLREPSPRPPSP